MVICMSEFMWRIEQLVTAVSVMGINNRNNDSDYVRRILQQWNYQLVLQSDFNHCKS
jgi:hypothetical protein